MNGQVRKERTGGDGYVRAYRSFLRLKELKLSDKMVFLGLWSFGNTSGICWPSHAELAKASAVSSRQVRTSLKNLKEMGLVMTEKRETGRPSSLRYRLAPLEQAAQIVTGKKGLEEAKARWVESLGETSSAGNTPAEEEAAAGNPAREDRKKLPTSPEIGAPLEGMRRNLPLSAASGGQNPRHRDGKRAPKGTTGREKVQELPQEAAGFSVGAEISAGRTRTIELEPEKKNKDPRPWERYLKRQLPRKKEAGSASPWGQLTNTRGWKGHENHGSARQDKPRQKHRSSSMAQLLPAHRETASPPPLRTNTAGPPEDGPAHAPLG